MSFTQALITSVKRPVAVSPNEWQITWSTTAPASTWWQIYVDGAYAWSGQTTSTRIAVGTSNPSITIGSVDAGDEYTPFSSAIPVVPKVYAELDWDGGTFEGTDIAGFYVYSGTAPGGAVNFSSPLATITAYPSGIYTDGFGFGGFGEGGFGEAASSYSWTSSVLASGLWFFAVVPFDAAGNSGTSSTVSVLISGPPGEPSILFGNTRIVYTFDDATEEAVLTWGASPG
jgi:hypothetical protein